MPSKSEAGDATDTPGSADQDRGDTSSSPVRPSASAAKSKKSPEDAGSRSSSSEGQEDSGASEASSPEPEAAKADSEAPPLPNEPPPGQADDGWEFHWRADYNAYIFYNRFTQAWQWENPRATAGGTTQTDAGTSGPPGATTAPAAPASAAAPSASDSVAGGYNPAIHGDYDPNAWYAQPAGSAAAVAGQQAADAAALANDPSAAYASAGLFNRVTGQWQQPGGEQGPERHGDEAKSRRQMNNFFDVDAAANSHDGRSLRAERAGKKPTKAELKAFKEKRKARKEEKRRAWLRD